MLGLTSMNAFAGFRSGIPLSHGQLHGPPHRWGHDLRCLKMASRPAIHSAVSRSLIVRIGHLLQKPPTELLPHVLVPPLLPPVLPLRNHPARKRTHARGPPEIATTNRSRLTLPRRIRRLHTRSQHPRPATLTAHPAPIRIQTSRHHRPPVRNLQHVRTTMSRKVRMLHQSLQRTENPLRTNPQFPQRRLQPRRSLNPPKMLQNLRQLFRRLFAKQSLPRTETDQRPPVIRTLAIPRGVPAR